MHAPRKVVVVGQGYVGLPLALRAVEVGYDVVGFDTDSARVAQLAAQRSFVGGVTSEALRQAADTGRYHPTTDPDRCRRFDIAVITVPTPLRLGEPDLSHVEAAALHVGKLVRPGSLVILESTTYPGTTEELLVPLLERESRLSAASDFFVGYSPERIDPGSARWQLTSIPKPVSGVNPASLEAVQRFYTTMVDQTVVAAGVREAELAKLLENTFRHVNIALVNEVAMYAWELGIDMWEALRIAGTKPFGYMRFDPGPGVGGHCLPIDPSYLSWHARGRLGHDFRFVAAANEINAAMPSYVARRVELSLANHGRSLPGSIVLLLGLAYKRNSGDARESPAVAIANELHDRGALVRGADPHVVEPLSSLITRVDASVDELRAADIVVVLADHDAFDLHDVQRFAEVVLDTRHCMPGGRNIEYL